jgi:hypothetical protein
MAAESLYLLVIIGLELQKIRGSNRTPDLTVLIRAIRQNADASNRWNRDSVC